MKKHEFMAMQAEQRAQKKQLQAERTKLFAQRDYAKARHLPIYDLRQRLQQIDWEREDLEKQLMAKWSDNISCNVRPIGGSSSSSHSSRYIDTPAAHMRPVQGGLCSPR